MFDIDKKFSTKGRRVLPYDRFPFTHTRFRESRG